MQADLPSDKKWMNAMFLKALKDGVKTGDFVQNKQSFKLSADCKKKLVEASKPKPKPKKVMPKKTATATKKTTAVKKTSTVKKTVAKKPATTAAAGEKKKSAGGAAKKTSAPKKKAVSAAANRITTSSIPCHSSLFFSNSRSPFAHDYSSTHS